MLPVVLGDGVIALEEKQSGVCGEQTDFCVRPVGDVPWRLLESQLTAEGTVWGIQRAMCQEEELNPGGKCKPQKHRASQTHQLYFIRSDALVDITVPGWEGWAL